MRVAAALGLGALVLLALPGMLDRLVARLLFQPTPGIDLHPEALGIEAREVWIETEDGVRLHGFFLPARGTEASQAGHADAPGRGRAILFLHGNAGNASHRLPNAAELAALGSDVLLLDYRGYGRSQGSPSEAGLYHDGRAGLRWLVAERGLPEARIVLFGRSLGGAVAVELARGRALAGVILESTFPSLAAMGRSAFGPPGAWVARGFDSRSKIPELRAPLLFFHGDHDEIVPIDLGRRLFERAPQPKAFEVIRGAGHNDTVLVGGRPYFVRIGRFLDEVAPTDAAPRP